MATSCAWSRPRDVPEWSDRRGSPVIALQSFTVPPESPEARTTPFGAKYIARGNAAHAYEAGMKERIVISEFPSVEKAIEAYNSPGYKAALQALGDGAERDIRIIAGAE